MNKHNLTNEAKEVIVAARDTVVASFDEKVAAKVKLEDEVKLSRTQTILVKEIDRTIEPKTIHIQGVVIKGSSRPAAARKPAKKPATKPSEGAVELQVSAKEVEANIKELHCGGKHKALLRWQDDDSFVLTINEVEKKYLLYHGAIAAYKRHVASQDAFKGKAVSFRRGIVSG